MTKTPRVIMALVNHGRLEQPGFSVQTHSLGTRKAVNGLLITAHVKLRVSDKALVELSQCHFTERPLTPDRSEKLAQNLAQRLRDEAKLRLEITK